MTKKEQKRINELIRSLESFAQYQWDYAKEKSEPERYEGVAQGIWHAIGCLEEFKTDEITVAPKEYAKVYKRNGMNCVDLNGTQTYLPDDLSKVPGKWIDGEYYSETVTVQTSV